MIQNRKKQSRQKVEGTQKETALKGARGERLVVFGRTVSPRTSFVCDTERQEKTKRLRTRKLGGQKKAKSLAQERLLRVPYEKSSEFRRVRLEKQDSGWSRREVVKSKFVRREEEPNASAEELQTEGGEGEVARPGGTDLFSGNFVIMASVIHSGRKL